MKKLEPRGARHLQRADRRVHCRRQMRRRRALHASIFRSAPSRTCLGIPEKDGDLFIKWIHGILELGIKDDNALMEAVREMTGYFAGHIELRKKNPSDDLISTLMNAQDKDGQPLADESMCWSSLRLSADRRHRHHLERDRFLAVASGEDAGGPRAPCRGARANAARRRGTAARLFAGDDGARGDEETTISGCPVKPGNMVLLSFPAANRDPAMFPDADKVVIDRKENRHAAFGLGIHRCVGSNLARMEMTVAIEEWLKRIPDFRLDPAGKVTWSEGTVRGRAPVADAVRQQAS